MTSRRLAKLFALFSTLILMALLTGGTELASAADYHWVPGEFNTETLPDFTFHYVGLTGAIVHTEGATLAREFPSAVELRTTSRAVLYVYLCSDAELAEFKEPARVLLRSGRELVVEADGSVPVLTPAAEALLSGLRQPIRISSNPILPTLDTGVRGDREHDPLIQTMVDGLTLENYMTTWHALEDFVTRYTFAPQNELSTQWILDQFTSFGLDAEFHYYQQSGTRRNVVATLPGLVDPDQVVYICAHLDATSPTPDACAPGADDNGSGTAAVIEAARILSQYQFDYTIKFACWNGEEQGLVGSAAYCSDMQSAGENIIGAFNMDMIAYRGTDAAPPDLVIYSNTASVGHANVLAAACDDYLPGLLEPVVLVESMGGSDHASFWNNGFQAITSIEDEAWGSDFCPWYHTCNDLISQYPQDYMLNCSKANLAALASTAQPLTPDLPYLILSEAIIDDDMSGSSSGDGDGSPNPGETIELWVEVENLGPETAQSVSGVLSSESGSVAIAVDTASWANVPAGGTGTNLQPFLFTVAGDAPDGEVMQFTLDISNAVGVNEIQMAFTVVAPRLSFYHVVLNDLESGNGNGVLDPGETVQLQVSLSNGGGRDANEVVGELLSLDPDLSVGQSLGTTSAVPMGSFAELSPPFGVTVSASAAEGQVFDLDLALSAGAGYQATSGFKVKVGARFFDDIEAEGAWNLSSTGDDASTGLWTRVDPIGTTYDGQPCQPEDDHTAAPGAECFVTGQGAPGGSAGGADVDGGKTTLSSPIFDTTNIVDPRVSYWRWYTNNLGNNGNEDEWLVQVSNDGGGNWTDLERTTASNNSWQEMSFLLDDYISPSSQVVFRFVAADEINGSLVEAAVDDFTLSGQTGTVTAVTDVPVLSLGLSFARPNPVRERSSIGYSLPSAGHVSLKLYSVDGRLVRTLVDNQMNAGVHDVLWDGSNDAGRKVVPGVYFYRLQAEERELHRKLVLLR